MSFKEYELMPHPFGWKVEYWDGNAHLTPRYYGVKTKLALQHRAINESWRIVPANIAFKEQAIAIFFETFQDSVEFCDWPTEEISWYRNEIWRSKQLGLSDRLKELERERDKWYELLEDDWKY